MGNTVDRNELLVPVVGWQLVGVVAAIIDGEHVNLSHRQQAVLALLLTRANTSVSVDELADALWGESRPKTARNSVQRFVADIRLGLGEHSGRLETTNTGYRLEVLEGELDADRARTALEQGQGCLHDDPGRALKLFEIGANDMRGTPLQGIESDVLDRIAIGPLRELATTLLASRFEASLALGHHVAIADDLRRFALDNPSSEQAWALHMLGLYRSGRQREALEAGEQLRQWLADEHGITPSPIIAKLTHQILNHADEIQLATPQPTQRARPDAGAKQNQLPARLARSITGPIAGRESLISRSHDIIDQLNKGAASVSLLAGEPGVGKTRLAAELASQAADAGFTVFYGRSDEDTAIPLGVWAEILDQLASHDHVTFEQVAQGSARESLGMLLPGLAPETRTPDLVDGTSELRRASLFQAITQMLQTFGMIDPLVVVLDDLQWADTSSLTLLRHVVRQLSAPVWLIVTYRDNELTEEHLLSDVVATLLREPHVQATALEGIDTRGLQALVQSIVPDVNEARLPEFAEALRRETKGNPFFASEIVRNMIEAAPDDRTLHLRDSDQGVRTVPDTVRQVIRQRVARLGEKPAAALRSAAAFGREFKLSELSAVLDTDADAMLALLEPGLKAQVISELETQSECFVFAHDLMHHSLYSDLSLARRRRLHGRIASAILAAGPIALGEAAARLSRASEIAGHFLAARDEALATETVQAVQHAADVAAQRHAPAEAASLLGRGLEILDEPAIAARIGDSNEVAELRLRMLAQRGLELRNAGDPGYRRALLDAGDAAHEMGDIDAEVAAALANTRGLQTNVWEVDTERVAQLKRAVAGLGEEESARRANLLASLASEQWAEEDRIASQVLRAESITLARRVNHRETLINTLARAARARNSDTSAAEFRDLASEMQAMIPESHGFDPYLMINVLRTIQNQALRDADPALLQAMTQAIRDLTDRTQLPICHRSNLLTDVLLAGLAGDAERYLQLAEKALTLSLEMGDPESFIAYEGHYFFGMNMLGRANEVLPMVAQVAVDRADIDIYAAIAALGHTVTGQPEHAFPLVDQAYQRGFLPGVDDYAVQALQIWADSAAASKHVDACAAIYDLLAPHANRFSGHVVHVTQPVDLSLGRLCHSLDRYDEALGHYDISDRLCRDFGAQWMQGMTDVSRAETLLGRAQGGDPDKANALLDQAIARADEHNHQSVVQLAGWVRTSYAL